MIRVMSKLRYGSLLGHCVSCLCSCFDKLSLTRLIRWWWWGMYEYCRPPSCICGPPPFHTGEITDEGGKGGREGERSRSTPCWHWYRCTGWRSSSVDIEMRWRRESRYRRLFGGMGVCVGVGVLCGCFSRRQV